MRKGQYQPFLGILIIISIVVSVGLIYYFSFKPKIENNQTTTSQITSTTTNTVASTATGTQATSQTISTTTRTGGNSGGGGGGGGGGSAPSTVTTTSSTATTTTTTTTSSTVQASYVISIVGSTVQALNMATGNVDFSSGNAGIVIQNTINSLKSGGKILIRAGTYMISTSIGDNGVNGIELYGEGNSTILRLASAVNSDVIGLGPINNWYIHDLQIDGNKTGQTSNSQHSDCILIWNCKNITLEGIYVHDCRTIGIHFSHSSDSKILSNLITDIGANGITIDNAGGGQGILVQGNIVDGISDVGITTWGGNYTTINDNIIVNANHNDSPFATVNGGTDSGANSHIAIMHEGPSNYNITVTNNVIHACGSGLYSSAASSYIPGAMNTNITWESNVIYDCGTGMVISVSSENLVKANNITSCTSQGILMTGASNNTIVDTNVISGSQTGIEIRSGSIGNTVINNVLRGNTVALIDKGIGTVIANNTVS